MTPAINEKLGAAEIAAGRAALEAARDRMAAATEGLSEAQWNYRPTSGGWSPAGIVEHSVLVQELVLGPIAQALDAAPETPGEEAGLIDSIVKTKLVDRSRRFPSPEPTHPAGRWTPQETLARLGANTGRFIERLEATPGLRKRRLPSPPLKAITGGQHELMDGYQWILATAFHTDRHTQQILDLKAEAGFPES
jgi:hypothetical protein